MATVKFEDTVYNATCFFVNDIAGAVYDGSGLTTESIVAGAGFTHAKQYDTESVATTSSVIRSIEYYYDTVAVAVGETEDGIASNVQTHVKRTAKVAPGNLTFAEAVAGEYDLMVTAPSIGTTVSAADFTITNTSGVDADIKIVLVCDKV